MNFKSLLWWIYIYLSLWMPLDQKIEMYSKLQWSNVFKKEYVCTTEPMQDEKDDEGSARTDRAVCFSLAAAMSSEVVWTLWWHKRPDLLEYGARYNLLEELRVTFWAPNFLSSRSLMSLMTIWPFHSYNYWCLHFIPKCTQFGEFKKLSCHGKIPSIFWIIDHVSRSIIQSSPY